MELSDLPGRNELIAKILEYEQFTELKLKPKIRELEKIKVKLDPLEIPIDCAIFSV